MSKLNSGKLFRRDESLRLRARKRDTLGAL